MKCLIPYHILRHWTADVKKKKLNPTNPDYETSYDAVHLKWEQAGWVPEIHNQYLQTQTLHDPRKRHFTIYCILPQSPPSKLKTTPMPLAWRWITSIQANKRSWESAYYLSKPQISANTTVTSKKFAAVGSWYFAKVSALKLNTTVCWGTPCYHVVIHITLHCPHWRSEALQNCIVRS